MMKNRETTMKNDENDEKKQWKVLKKREQNNEKWWKIEKKQWKMMNNRETMKTDQKER
jgi:hypothetical protein